MTFVEPPIAAPDDSISRSAAINIVKKYLRINKDLFDAIEYELGNLPSAQSEIIHCRECEYGAQDEDGWWYCRSFGCQVGDEDGSGFCADAERKNNV